MPADDVLQRARRRKRPRQAWRAPIVAASTVAVACVALFYLAEDNIGTLNPRAVLAATAAPPALAVYGLKGTRRVAKASRCSDYGLPHDPHINQHDGVLCAMTTYATNDSKADAMAVQKVDIVQKFFASEKACSEYTAKAAVLYVRETALPYRNLTSNAITALAPDARLFVADATSLRDRRSMMLTFRVGTMFIALSARAGADSGLPRAEFMASLAAPLVELYRAAEPSFLELCAAWIVRGEQAALAVLAQLARAAYTGMKNKLGDVCLQAALYLPLAIVPALVLFLWSQGLVLKGLPSFGLPLAVARLLGRAGEPAAAPPAAEAVLATPPSEQHAEEAPAAAHARPLRATRKKQRKLSRVEEEPAAPPAAPQCDDASAEVTKATDDASTALGAAHGDQCADGLLSADVCVDSTLGSSLPSSPPPTSSPALSHAAEGDAAHAPDTDDESGTSRAADSPGRTHRGAPRPATIVSDPPVDTTDSDAAEKALADDQFRKRAVSLAGNAPPRLRRPRKQRSISMSASLNPEAAPFCPGAPTSPSALPPQPTFDASWLLPALCMVQGEAAVPCVGPEGTVIFQPAAFFNPWVYAQPA